MQRGKISIFTTFGGHLGFLRKMKKCGYLKTVRDRAISSEFLTRRVVQEYPKQMGKSVNISKTIRDRAISREFLTRRVVQQCRIESGKFLRVSYAKGF